MLMLLLMRRSNDILTVMIDDPVQTLATAPSVTWKCCFDATIWHWSEGIRIPVTPEIRVSMSLIASSVNNVLMKEDHHSISVCMG